MELLKPFAFLRSSLPLLLVAGWGISTLIVGFSYWQPVFMFAGLGLQGLFLLTHYRYPVRENPKVSFYWQGASVLLMVIVMGFLVVKKQRIDASFRGPIKKAERTR